jgi:FKBP-type peptidyl-prolyl cis-trans isomerase FkpA
MKHYAFLVAALLAAAACNDAVTGLGPPSDPTKETFAALLGVDIAQMSKTKEGVYYKDLIVGTGVQVTDTAVTVNVTYAGYLKDGKLIDSGTNVAFSPTGIIAGFRIGMMGMKEGGKRKVVIPSALGYDGDSVRNPSDNTIKIPRQSTLVFDIEVVKVTNPTPTTT